MILLRRCSRRERIDRLRRAQQRRQDGAAVPPPRWWMVRRTLARNLLGMSAADCDCRHRFCGWRRPAAARKAVPARQHRKSPVISVERSSGHSNTLRWSLALAHASARCWRRSSSHSPFGKPRLPRCTFPRSLLFGRWFGLRRPVLRSCHWIRRFTGGSRHTARRQS